MRWNSLGDARLSSQRAGEIAQQIITHRHLPAAFKYLARSVQIASEASAEKWGLRLNRQSIMLKVGFVEVLTIDRDRFHLLVENHLIPTKHRAKRQRFVFSRTPYKNAPNCDTCDMDLSLVPRALEELLPAHESAIRIAARAPRRADIVKDHSPGLIKFLSQELGLRLPQPAHHAPDARMPEEIRHHVNYLEGAKVRIEVNRYERDGRARAHCIEKWGLNCVACGSSLADKYGPQVFGLIHVHHLRPLANNGKRNTVDPVKDLRPVCPNCHAVIHSVDPPRSIEEVKKMLRRKEKN